MRTFSASAFTVLALSQVGPTASLNLRNFRMRVDTTTYCVAITDKNGVEAPCARSIAMETLGMTLPGMEENSLTTLKDVIMATDGILQVESSPTRPFTYMLSTSTNTTRTSSQLFKGQVRMTKLEPVQDHHEATLDLQEGGWELQSENDDSTRTYHKFGLGFDQESGMNFTTMYEAGIAPNKYILITDMEDKPLTLTALNTYHEDFVHQTTSFTNHQELPAGYSLENARATVYKTYQVAQDHTGRRLSEQEIKAFPPVEESQSQEHVPEILRDFYEGNSFADLDWMSTGNLRRTSDFQGIPYFKIPAGSAAEKFFSAGGARRLASVVAFQMPTGCTKAGRKDSANYCLHLDVGLNTDVYGLEVTAGCMFRDVNNPDISANLTLSLTLNKDMSFNSLSALARGCAVVWQYGVSVLNLHITACLEGKAATTGDTFDASLEASVKFALAINCKFCPGDIIAATIRGTISVHLEPNHVIVAKGSIVVERTLLVAGAGMGLDIVANTVDNNPKKWNFQSGANFKAWVHVWIFYNNEWSKRFPIWHAGPVTFK